MPPPRVLRVPFQRLLRRTAAGPKSTLAVRGELDFDTVGRLCRHLEDQLAGHGHIALALTGAIATADTAGGAVRADRYSLRPNPPAVRYGATLECRDGWKLFLSCYGTARPGKKRPEQPFQPLSHV